MDQEESKLLDEIGRVAREQDAEDDERFDERWRRLSAGTLSEAEDAALRAEAQESEETRLDYEVLKPMGAELHDRIARQWQAATPTPTTAGRRRWSRAYPWLAAAAALTLAVVGWQLRPGTGAQDLPEYKAELSGQVRMFRSGEGDSGLPVFAPGSPFELLLRPDQLVTDPGIERRLYLESSSGELSPWRVDLTISADGVVKVTGEVGRDLLIDPGDWTLIFVYGRSGRLPDPERLRSARPDDDWRVARVPFRVVAESAAVPLRVEVAGCRAYYPERRCVPRDRLTLWVEAPGNARLELWVGGRTVDEPGESVDGGRRYSLAVSPGDRDIQVRATSLKGSASWSLGLEEWQMPDWLIEARQLFADGELEAARKRIEDRLAGADRVPAALARGTLARVLMRLGKPIEEVQKLLLEAIEFHNAATDGQSKDLIHLARDLKMLIYLARRYQGVSEVYAHLEQLAVALVHEAPAEPQLSLFQARAVLGRKIGFYREALEAARQGLGLARRLGLQGRLATAQETAALVLQELGRFSEAIDLFRQLEALAESGAYEKDPCGRARLLNNHAWVLIRADDPTLGDPLELHTRALEIAEQEGCRGTDVLDILLDQALVLVKRGQTEAGRQAIALANGLIGQAIPLQHRWRVQIEGLLDLQEGLPREALGHFSRLAELSRHSFPEGEWLAQVGQAQAHRQLGDLLAARDALAAADALLDADSLEVPLYAGRGHFMAEREESTQLYLATLLDVDDVDQALQVARRSRSRLLRGVHLSSRLNGLGDEGRNGWNREVGSYLRLRSEIEATAADDWQLDEESLKQAREARSGRWQEALEALDRAVSVLEPRNPTLDLPPLDGQVVLVYHPLPGGWVGLGKAGDRTLSHRFELTDSAFSDRPGLAAHLLEPFREILTEGCTVRILPYGRLYEVDFHALPWNGDVLLAEHPVVYGLDLAAAPASPRSGQAMVVSDPRGDLPAASVEGEAVAQALEAASAAWEVVQLTGERATRPKLSKRFGTDADRFDLLHYAGHSAFEPAAPGADGFSLEANGWESALLLAREGRFTLGDVLALGDRAPAEVVLSSCESAVTAISGGVANLGLAQAFIAAGSERVVAAMRPVGDQDTAAFFRQLYGEGVAPLNLAEALRRTQLAWRHHVPGADWASFRLLEP